MAGKINAVFYAKSYHPIQSGSIDGTDVLPHDNAVYRALLCSAAGLYDPSGDPKVIGDPYCTVFVGRLSRVTDEESLKKVMSRYGRVKNLRLVRDIVTGTSRGYAFVEYETEREMRCAYEDAHHSIIDDSEIIVDYNRQQLMPGWIPRRLGGGLGGKKESGQLRFGGRERPFRAPLRPIPYDELKRLGIPPPPEGRYISRFEIPSPPRRRSSSSRTERKYSPSRQRHDSPSRMKSKDREDISLIMPSRKSKDREDASPRRRSSSTERFDSSHKHHRDMEYLQKEDSSSGKLRSEDREEPFGRQRKSSTDRVDSSHKHRMVWENSQREDSPLGKRRSEDREEPHGRHMKSSTDRVDASHKHHREREYSHREDPSSRKRSKVVEERRSSRDRDGSSHRYHRHYNDHSYGHQRSASEDHSL